MAKSLKLSKQKANVDFDEEKNGNQKGNRTEPILQQLIDFNDKCTEYLLQNETEIEHPELESIDFMEWLFCDE